MNLLAVKLAVALVLSESQADRLSDHERLVWSQYRPSVVTLFDDTHATGVAALIDDAGYFVTHSSSVVGNSVEGRIASGKVLKFNVISRDGTTKMVLLKADAWVPGTAKPFRVPHVKDSEGGTIIAVLPSGPIRAAYVSKGGFGVLKPSRRLVTLSEIRFEASSQLVGGALILSESGELVGTLNATLERPEPFQPSGNQVDRANVFVGGGQNGSPIGQNLGGAIPIQKPVVLDTNVGPGDMTVAYTVGPDVVQHTLLGFLSPNHEAEYASLGILCDDNPGGGALIKGVTTGSPANKSHLQPGDVLLNIGYAPIQNKVDFATTMLQQKVGKQIQLVIKRGRATLLIDIVPDRAVE